MTTLATASTTGPAASTGTPTGEPRYATAYRYTDRETKARYIAEKYAPILHGSVLDVGCDKAPLRALVASPSRYTGVDMAPGSDIVLNLDASPLPLANRSYDTVVCTDVLEHLERCHGVFDELCRVANGHVVVSLPNPVRCLLDALRDGAKGRLKYYGLPSQPPPDRHRWFFGAEDARAFVETGAARNGFDVEQMDFESVGNLSWIVNGTDVMDSLNLRLGTMWAVLRRA
ncbi:MAG: methyltransferase domain-containing protein [Planctomycetota bacterium]|nr:methyltransferase domain-containing protein [Planctomycetota bacterium]